MSGEMQSSISALSMFPGFRFSPTDQELILYHLKNKLEGLDYSDEVIPEIEICKQEPWDLPAKALIQSDNEWFFFSPRGRKYPNGSQSKRATGCGYWKATGKERSVKSGSHPIGTKRTLVFHRGRAPRGQRTEWIMHEFCTSGSTQDSLVLCRIRNNAGCCPNDPSRKGSKKGGYLSGGNDGTTVSSEEGIEQETLIEGLKDTDCCSGKQIDSESDYVLMNRNVFPQHVSSSCHQDCVDEEDCFAEIMKDDIVKLDESTLWKASDSLIIFHEKSTVEMFKESVQSTMPNTLPSQGTAKRRIRLNKHKMDGYLAKFSEVPRDDTETGCNENLLRIYQTPKCLTMMFSGADRHLSISVVFVLLTLLLLLLSLLGGIKHLKELCLPS